MHRLPDLDDDDFKIRPPWVPMIVFTLLAGAAVAGVTYWGACQWADGGCRINWGTWTAVAGWRKGP